MIRSWLLPIILTLLLLPDSAHAQPDSSRLRWEIGIGVPYAPAIAYGDFVPSISVKRKWDKNVVRAGLNFSLPPYNDGYGYLANLGYERILFGKRFQAFAGADIGYWRTVYPNNRNYIAYGIGPVLGIEYHITDRFFVQTEAACFIGPDRFNPSMPGDVKGISFTFYRFLSLHAGITLFK